MRWVVILAALFLTSFVVGSRGMLVTKVIDGSPAAKAGFQVGDVVTSLDGSPILSQEALEAVIGNRAHGDAMKFVYQRSGTSRDLEVEYPAFSETDFGLRGNPDMPPDLLQRFQQSSSVADFVKLAETANAAHQTYIAAWLYLHAADLHDADYQAYAKKGLTLLGDESDPALRTMGLLIVSGDQHPLPLEVYQELIKSLEAGKFHVYEAQVCTEFGYAEYLANHYDLSAQAFEQARTILEADRPGSDELADLYHMDGLVATMMGKFAVAEDFTLKAVAIREKTGPGSIKLAMSYLDAGLAAGERGDSQAAIERSTKAIDIFKNYPQNADLLATSYNNLALCYQLGGDMANAEKSYKTCIEMEKLSMPESPVRGITDGNLAILLLNQGKSAEAAPYATESLSIAVAKSPGTTQEAAARAVAGLTDFFGNRIDSASEQFDKSQQLYHTLAPDSIAEALGLENQALVCARKNEPAKAKQLFGEAFVMVDQNRNTIVSADERMMLQEETYLLPRLYARSLVQNGDKAGALLVLDSSRGRALEDLMAERSVDFAKGAPKTLVSRARENQEAMAGVKGQTGKLMESIREAEAKGDTVSVTSLGKSLADLKSQAKELASNQNDIEREIRTASPAYAALKYPSPIGLDQLSGVVAPGDLVLAFNTMGDETEIFTCRKTDRLEVETDSDAISYSKLISLTQQFRQSILSQSGESAAGQELADLLIKPVLKKISGCRHLILMTDTGLNDLPFSALPVGKSQTLGDLAPITYETSMSLYKTLIGTTPARSGFLGVAFPTRAQAANGNTAETSSRLSAGRTLPNAGVEVRSIAALYPGSQVLIDDEATPSRVISKLGDARYIHFACHGLLDSVSPLDSGLALCPEPGSDGLLLARDFLKLKLNADLVTLSACDSGRGKDTFTEGLTGFARSLYFAGSRSVLVSLWPVEDESTAILMRAFYAKLKTSATKDVALKSAISTLKSNPKYSDPKYWAPFILCGAYN